MMIIKSISAWSIGVLFIVVLFPVTFFIWLLVLPFDRHRIITHRFLTAQSILLLRLLPISKVRIEGKEKASGRSTYVMISNHQSLADILVINCLGYDLKWISKIENTRVPVLGWYLKMAGYIVVDRNDDESKAQMLARSYMTLKGGRSVMIFPEGTRSLNGEPGFFKRGAFQLAIEAKVPILPMVICGTGNLLPKKGIMLRDIENIRLKVLDPVIPESFGTSNPETLALRFRNIITSELNKMKSIIP